jgi:hypothetical protein
LHLGGSFYLERSQDEFGVRSHGVIDRTTSDSKYYPLPQSDVEMYKRFRPEDPTALDYQGQEVIGPYQVEGSGGYALFRNGEATRFRIEKSANGTETAVHIERFPPPPSLY